LHDFKRLAATECRREWEDEDGKFCGSDGIFFDEDIFIRAFFLAYIPGKMLVTRKGKFRGIGCVAD
jgi:hypothetical protein